MPEQKFQGTWVSQNDANFATSMAMYRRDHPDGEPGRPPVRRRARRRLHVPVTPVLVVLAVAFLAGAVGDVVQRQYAFAAELVAIAAVAAGLVALRARRRASR